MTPQFASRYTLTISCMALIALLGTGCGGGSNFADGSDTGGGNFGNTTPINGPTRLYFSVRAYNQSGIPSSHSPSVNTIVTAGQNLTIHWDTPTTYSDGSCMNDLQGYTISYGRADSIYTSSFSLDQSDSRLSCQLSAVSSCGDIRTCSINLTI